MPASEADLPAELRTAFPGPLLAQWLAARYRLRNAGYGQALPRTYERLSPGIAVVLSPDAAISLADLISRVAIRVDVNCAEKLCEGVGRYGARLGGDAGFRTWCQLVRRVAETAPVVMPAFLAHQSHLLDHLDLPSLEHWVDIGLRVGTRDGAALERYFNLASPESRAVIEDAGHQVTFRSLSGEMRAYYTALFGPAPPMRSSPPGQDHDPAPRSSFASGIVLVPNSYPGSRSKEADRHLYHATLAHIGAHMRNSPAPMPRGQFKPIQLALIELLEDARVEALAMVDMPGLARLWRPYHDVAPGGLPTVRSLFRRLARALIDPGFEDPDEWVMRGRARFAAPDVDLKDPAISRLLAGPLGYDLGQRRVQLNAKDYVVEPAYRDDGQGLWEPLPPDGDPEPLDVETRFASFGQNPSPPKSDRPQKDPTEDGAKVQPIRPRASEPGRVLARYPEYDYRSARSLPDWTSVKAYPQTKGDMLFFDRIKAENAPLIASVSASLRAARLGRSLRLRRQVDGPLLDLDAAISATADLRGGQMPDALIFEDQGRPRRDFAVSLLLDASRSTGVKLPHSDRTILQVQRDATGILALAMEDVGDRLSVAAFNSNGREDVRFFDIKGFEDPVSPVVGSALSSLCPAYSTRLGAALRHAGAGLGQQAAHFRLVLVLTDGEPSDIDCPDPDLLIEDARRAVQDLAAKRVFVFCVGLGPEHAKARQRIFGSKGYAQIDQISALPRILPRIYTRLTG